MPYVIVCRYDRQTGRIYEPEYIPTVPENEIPENFDNFFDKPHPADICMHPGGRYLFVTNRGSDTVAIYSVDGSDGSLSLAGFSASGGVWPWACRFDTAGKFFYTGNKNDGKVAAFSFDDKSGRLNKLDHCVMIERPVCIRTLMVE
jgi:6-phosphogluconolactonase